MYLSNIHDFIAFVVTPISIYLGLFVFPIQIKQIKDSGTTKNVSVLMGVIPSITYSLWLFWGLTHVDENYVSDIKWAVVLANIPGAINSMRLTYEFHKDNRKILQEVLKENKGIILANIAMIKDRLKTFKSNF